MKEEINVAVIQPPTVLPLRRISWAAIIAGVIVALVAQLLMSLLGLAIGASTVHPLTEAEPTSGLGLGAGIWFLLTGLIALFLGGWTAGRLAGVPRPVDSLMHGVLTWGVTTLLTFYLLTTTLGGIIGGTARGLGQMASSLGQGAASAMPGLSETIKNNMPDTGIDWSNIKDEATTLLQQTGKPELQPDALKDKAKDAGQEAKDAAKNTAENPQAAQANVTDLLNKVFNRTSDAANAADRDALINVVAARTGKSKDEAAKIVDRWEATYRDARVKYEKVKDEAAQKAREVGEATAKGVTQAAFWTFLGLTIGLGAAAFGGYVSVEPDPTVVRNRRGNAVVR